MATANQTKQSNAWPPTSMTVDKKSKEVMEGHAALEMVKALLGGTASMRAAGDSLLPRWPSEEAGDYKKRLEASTLYPAYSYTVNTLSAKPFSQELALNDDVPERIKGFAEDIDMQGRNLHAFAADEFRRALGYGFAGILVEYPDPKKVGAQETATGVRTQQQEAEAGLRPYWASVEYEDILGWKTAVVSGNVVLTQLRFTEEVEEDAPDPFEVKCQKQVRVLEPGRWAVYRKDKDKGHWNLFEDGTTTIDVVPFAPVYGERYGFMQAKAPLLALAFLNVKHWQQQSDQDNLMHVARVPILALTGYEEDEKKKFQLVVGSSAAVKLPAGAELKYVEHTGEAINAGKQQLDDLKEEMRQSGASMLVLQPGEITATQVEHEAAPARCALERMVLMFEDSINLALSYTAMYINEANGGGTAKVFNDFGAATLAEASAELLLKSRVAGEISGETYFEELKRRGIVAPEKEYEEEQRRIQDEGPVEGGPSGNQPGLSQGGTGQ